MVFRASGLRFRKVPHGHAHSREGADHTVLAGWWCAAVRMMTCQETCSNSGGTMWKRDAWLVRTDQQPDNNLRPLILKRKEESGSRRGNSQMPACLCACGSGRWITLICATGLTPLEEIVTAWTPVLSSHCSNVDCAATGLVHRRACKVPNAPPTASKWIWCMTVHTTLTAVAHADLIQWGSQPSDHCR